MLLGIYIAVLSSSVGVMAALARSYRPLPLLYSPGDTLYLKGNNSPPLFVTQVKRIDRHWVYTVRWNATDASGSRVDYLDERCLSQEPCHSSLEYDTRNVIILNEVKERISHEH